MRMRLALPLALVLAGPFLFALPAMAAGTGEVVLAQQPGGDQEDPGDPVDEGDAGDMGEELEQGEGEGQDDPDTQTGAGEDEQTEAEPEEGPVWTYQMARISLVLLALMLLATGLAYHKLVTKRQRTGV
jgi:hypothetical protein